MLSLQRTLSVGYLLQHPTRMTLVVISIALGVGTLVATRALDDSLHQAAKGAVNPFATFADLLVVNGQTGVPADLADRLKEAKLPGLADAQPLVMGRAVLIDLDNQSVRLLGIQLFAEETKKPAVALAGNNPWGLQFSPTDETAGVAWALLRGAKPVVLGSILAERMKSLPNGTHEFRLRRAAGEVQTVTSIGSVRLQGQAKLLEDEAVFTDVATASSIIYPQKPKSYASQLNLKLAPGADKKQVRQEVEQFLKEQGQPGLVQTIEATEEMASDVTASLELGFSIGGSLALLVGLFLVYNALSVSVAERRHDIGILRAVGATRRQIAGLFVGEAMVLGLAGSLLGLPLGYALAWAALGPMHRVLSEVFVKLPATVISVSPLVMLLAVGAGMLATLLASLVPAIQAADEQPADAVRRAPRTTRPFYFALQGATAFLLAIIAVGIGFGRSYLPPRLGAYAAPICLFAALLVAMPLLAALVGRLLQPFFRFFLGLEGRLAGDNLVRSPGRTGLVIAALAATACLILGTAGFTYSTEHAINHWIDDNIAADLYVTAGSGVSQAGFGLPMDESVGVELTHMKSVEAALPVRFHYFTYHNQFVDLIATNVHAFAGIATTHGSARNLSRFPWPPVVARSGDRATTEGQPCAVASDNFAALQHVHVGDHVIIPGGRTPTVDLQIIGTVVDYTSNRGSLLVDRRWYAEEYSDNQVDVFDVYLRPGVDARAEQEELTQPGGWAAHEAVFVERRDQLRAAVTDQVNRIYHLAYAQEFVVGLVALLGVISALFISVLQRRRELGLLRAVGATQGQVLRSVMAEASLMGMIGAVIGLGAGLLLEWYILSVVVFDEAGLQFPMLAPWISVGVIAAASVVLTTLVGLWPAWSATRLRITEAIAYE